MTDFFCRQNFVFVAFLCNVGDFLVEFEEGRVASRNDHILCVAVKHNVVAADLRIRRFVHFKPRVEQSVLSVVGLAVFRKSVPVPFFARVFFDKLDCRNHLIARVRKNGRLLVAHRRSHRERGKIVVSVFDLVAHKRAVASGVAVDCAYAADGEVFVDCATEFGAGHRAYVGRNLKFFGNFDVVKNAVLRDSRPRVDCRHFFGHEFEVGEAHCDHHHTVFVHNDDLFVEFVVFAVLVADTLVALKERIHSLRKVSDDAVVLLVTYAKLRTAYAFEVTVDIVESRHIVAEPSVSEQRLDRGGFHNEFAHNEKVFEPATEVVHRVFEAAPFSASGRLFAGFVEFAEFFGIKFCAHTQCSPFSFCIFLISIASTNAWILVRSCPD